MSSVVLVIESSGGRVPDGALVVVCHGQQSGNDPALPPIAMTSVARDIKFACHEILFLNEALARRPLHYKTMVCSTCVALGPHLKQDILDVAIVDRRL